MTDNYTYQVDARIFDTNRRHMTGREIFELARPGESWPGGGWAMNYRRPDAKRFRVEPGDIFDFQEGVNQRGDPFTRFETVRLQAQQG